MDGSLSLSLVAGEELKSKTGRMNAEWPSSSRQVMEQVFLAAAELGCDDWRDWVLECRDRARACMRVGCHSSFKDKYAVCEVQSVVNVCNYRGRR